MGAAVVGLTLSAAALHAMWNALLRSGGDRLWSITVMSFVTTAGAALFALFLPAPLPDSWPYIGISAALQVAYSILLAYTYESGELSQVYPFIRGSVPILVSMAGFLVAGQRSSSSALLGIACVSAGIVSLGFDKRAEVRTVLLALATALFVASYVTTDGLGVRVAGNAQSYAAWIFLAYGALQPVVFLLLRRRIVVNPRSRETLKAVAAGALSLLSYGAVVTALSLGQLGSVSALRETSVVFSALIGRTLLHETVTGRRWAACFAVAFGAACIAYAP